MEFPLQPDEWNIFEADDFAAAEARDPGALGMELLAQCRPNGRIQDHFRVVLGGRQPLTVETGFTSLYKNSKYDMYKLRIQYWPRDIAIRRNSVVSPWRGIYDILSERNAAVVNSAGEAVPTDDVLKVMDEEAPRGEAASVRWNVVIGADKKMRLDLVALPSTEATISAKPILNRYNFNI